MFRRMAAVFWFAAGLTTVALGQPALLNGSFETPRVGVCPDFQYTPPQANWTFKGGGGITTGGCNAKFNAPAPPPGGGGQMAFLHSQGSLSSIRQSVSGLVAGHTYEITFYAAARRDGGCAHFCGGLDFMVMVGDSPVLQVERPPTAFRQYRTNPFTAIGDVWISFAGIAPQGTDETSFIDLVSLVEAGAPSASENNAAASPRPAPRAAAPAAPLAPAAAPSPARSATAPPAPSALVSPSPAHAAASMPIPARMIECETADRCDGFWTFNGREGTSWWTSGARGKLAVEHFEPNNIVIVRMDFGGTSPGMTAVYTGKLIGNRFEGDVKWDSQNPGSKPTLGKWSATIDPTGDTHADREPALPVFLKDKTFTYDLAGEWRLVFPENSPRHPFITAVALVKDGDFQLIVGDPNIFYPIGESMFNGRLAGNHITGDWMDAPAHHGDGYRGYAWTKADIQIVDANNLAGPAGILLKRSSPEQGANRICDPTSFANIDAAHALNYANKDYELKNFGNAACWLYVSAVLGNSDAQLYMGVVLHFGTGVKTDMNQSFLWFKKAAFQDNLTAERAVAHCYGGGFGVSKDAALAKAWSTRIDGQVEVLRRDAAAQEKMDRNLAAWGILLGGGLSEHQTRVEDYQSRGMSRSSAEDAAKGDEADATFFHSLTHAYKPPPMPPPH